VWLKVVDQQRVLTNYFIGRDFILGNSIGLLTLEVNAGHTVSAQEVPEGGLPACDEGWHRGYHLTVELSVARVPV
jgi:hypothetical protein